MSSAAACSARRVGADFRTAGIVHLWLVGWISDPRRVGELVHKALLALPLSDESTLPGELILSKLLVFALAWQKPTSRSAGRQP